MQALMNNLRSHRRGHRSSIMMGRGPRTKTFMGDGVIGIITARTAVAAEKNDNNRVVAGLTHSINSSWHERRFTSRGSHCERHRHLENLHIRHATVHTHTRIKMLQQHMQLQRRRQPICILTQAPSRTFVTSQHSRGHHHSREKQPNEKDDAAAMESKKIFTPMHHSPFGGDSDNQQTSQQAPPPPPPPLSKLLSILVPESDSLMVALTALTVATVATMQYPNAIGQVIDILSAAAASVPTEDIHTAADCGTCTVPTNEAGDICTPPNDGITDDSTNGGTGDATARNQPSVLDVRQQVRTIALQLTTYFTVGAVATYVHTMLFDSVGQKIGANLRKELFGKLIHQSAAFFDRNRAGELANRLSTDVHEVAEHLVQNLGYFLSNLVRALTATVQMALISPALALHLTPLPVLLWGCSALFGSSIKHWSRRHLDSLARSTHVATERFVGHRTVLSFGRRRAEHERYSSVIDAAYGYSRLVAAYQGAFLGSSYLVGNGALMGILIVGSFHVLDGSMTAGSLAGFCMYAGHLADSTIELSEATGGFLKAQGSGARLFNLLEKDRPVREGSPSTVSLPPTYDATIRFDAVEFAYPSHPMNPILNKLSFTLREGELLAVTGSSGSGKSSIVSLLMRFYEPTTLHGRDFTELDESWLRTQIAFVGQEPLLFHASIYENVAYGKLNATKDEVVQACIAANAHRFISELPDSYDTIVGERGASISGGQKQRLCIARALLANPRILALDEASSALDTQAEQELLLRLRSLVETTDTNLSTVLFITHERSVLKACDRVAVLSDGRISETGPFSFDPLDITKGNQLTKL